MNAGEVINVTHGDCSGGEIAGSKEAQLKDFQFRKAVTGATTKGEGHTNDNNIYSEDGMNPSW